MYATKIRLHKDLISEIFYWRKYPNLWYFFHTHLQAFSVVFQNAIDRAEKSDEVKQRVLNLIDSITYMVFMYTSRGLFEKDKLIFTSQVTFQVYILVVINP